MENRAWRDFERGKWCDDVDVRDFIQRNYTPYEGDDSFLAPATEATKQLWAQVMELTKEEREAFAEEIPMCIYFLSASGSYVTGQVLSPNGGYVT